MSVFMHKVLMQIYQHCKSFNGAYPTFINLENTSIIHSLKLKYIQLLQIFSHFYVHLNVIQQKSPGC